MNHLKALSLLILCSLTSLWGWSQTTNGYHIKVKFKQAIPDNYVYLANYYAKAMPTVYVKDSALVSKNKKELVLQSKQELIGGIFILFFNNKNKYIELVIDNGDKFEIEIDTLNLPQSVFFTHSKANDVYMKINKNFTDLRTNMATWKTELDQNKITKNQYTDAVQQGGLKMHQANVALANEVGANTLVGKIVYAVTPVEVTAPPLPTNIDSAQQLYLEKERYWNNYDFSDNRLMYTPLFENKLKYYFDRLVYNYIADSVIYEAEKLLYWAKDSKDHFRYTLNWITQYAHNSKVMGIDEVFVHLVEQYYMTGKVDWLTEAELSNYAKRAQALAPNVLGKKGANFELSDVTTLAPFQLYDFDAPYTLLVFWSIDCSVCKEEMPQLKELYDKVLKNKQVKVLSVPNGKTQQAIQEAIANYGIGDWKHIIDVKGNSDYLESYDAYSKPKIYLLDKNKIIRGKHLNHTNIEQVLNNQTFWK